jgi:hypothetical protein
MILVVCVKSVVNVSYTTEPKEEWGGGGGVTTDIHDFVVICKELCGGCPPLLEAVDVGDDLVVVAA